MKAALLFGPGEMRLIDEPVPAPGHGEVLVKVMRYAPYGTDLGAYLNKGGRYVSAYPTGIGADFSGTIAAIGTGVFGFAEGDRVSALTMAHCGVCRNCRAGKTNLCLDDTYLLAPRQTCCSEYTIVAARKLAKLPANVSFDDAAMLGGIVDALNANEMMRPQPGETYAVVGVGAMGWGAAAVARTTGARVIAIGGTGRRSELALACGAHEALPIAAHGEDVKERFFARVPGGADCVMETSASDWGVRQSFAIAGPGGRIALTGAPAPLPASPWDLVRRQLAVFGVRAGHHQDQALDLIAKGLIDLMPSVTHRLPLAEAPKAFAMLTGPDAKNIGRILIEME
jgi:threonine dehydrogenase-like Zn-dependent dehydrogenase